MPSMPTDELHHRRPGARHRQRLLQLHGFPGIERGVRRGASLLPTAFLRLIKMIIAPLVFSTLVVGIAQDGRYRDRRARRRQGARLVHLRVPDLAHARPGAGAAVRAGQGDAAADSGCGAASGVQSDALSITGSSRTRFRRALSTRWRATRSCRSSSSRCSSAPPWRRWASAAQRIDVLDAVAHIMLKVTGYVMFFAPLAVFGALASIVAKEVSRSSASTAFSSASSIWVCWCCGRF